MSTHTFEIVPCTATIGAEVRGVQLAAVPDDAAALRTIEQALHPAFAM